VLGWAVDVSPAYPYSRIQSDPVTNNRFRVHHHAKSAMRQLKLATNHHRAGDLYTQQFEA